MPQMGTCNGNTQVFLTVSPHTLQVRNSHEDDSEANDSETVTICTLNDFFTNNIETDLSKISVLKLDGCGITELPSNVQKLNLKCLTLSNNNLQEVPSCLYSGLSALELLDLSHNCIKTFDVQPACNSTIVTLKLNNNKIHNFPHWILTLSCPKLSEVVYSNNRLVKLGAIYELNIKRLEMCNSQLRDEDFMFFRKIKTLEYLDVGNCQAGRNENAFKDLGQLFIKTQWKNIKVLKLNHLVVSILPQSIFEMTSLTELHMVSCDLSWLPDSVQYLTNLRLLDVSNNTICALPKQLSVLENLNSVKAPNNSISSVADFANNLKILDLYNNFLEIVPSCVDTVQLIDLEQNYCDTSLYQNFNKYKIKRDKLRHKFGCNRVEGFKLLPEEPYQDEHSSYYPSSDESEHESVQEVNMELESWDEEKPKMRLPRNLEINTSDDEWDGREEKKSSQKINFIKHYFDVNEDCVFSDAD